MDEKESQRLNEERQRKHEEANANEEKSQLIQPLQATPTELAEAIVSPGTQFCLTGSLITANSPLQGEVFNIPLQGFPTNGNSFGVLSSGVAADASNAGAFCSTCFDPVGVDTISLDLTFDVPVNPGNLTFEWKFGTEEFLGSVTNDFFNVLVNGTPIPGFPVTVQNGTFAPPIPNDVCYANVTPTIQTTTFDLTPFAGQTITVTFQVSDFGDCVVDSAAFIDNLQIEGCERELAITCPPDMMVSNTPGQCGANVNYPDPTVTGGLPPVNVTCSPASGSFFPVGTTTVTCTATDAAGNPSTCSFTVTVVDTEPPVITCPADITVFNDPGRSGAFINFPEPTVSDNCPGATAVCTPASGSFFPSGTTTVTCTATDAAGNTSTCSFNVRVIVDPCRFFSSRCRRR